jgi:hypothetical protein
LSTSNAKWKPIGINKQGYLYEIKEGSVKFLDIDNITANTKIGFVVRKIDKQGNVTTENQHIELSKCKGKLEKIIIDDLSNQCDFYKTFFTKPTLWQ